MKNKFIKITFGLILTYLLTAFIASILILQSEQENKKVNKEDIVFYASEYLSNEYLIKKGASLDCSGYTESVFKHFNYNLPIGANKQYLTYKLNNKETKPGDLVFFAIENSKVNHVGILINDSIFLHSPGKNKAVRTDNINSTYWLKYYIGVGRVINHE